MFIFLCSYYLIFNLIISVATLSTIHFVWKQRMEKQKRQMLSYKHLLQDWQIINTQCVLCQDKQQPLVVNPNVLTFEQQLEK